MAKLPVGDRDDRWIGGLPTISWWPPTPRMLIAGLSTNVIDLGACEASTGVPLGVANNSNRGW